jgi:RNA polymerase sigma-70 factor (ECF subfamily)
VAQEQLGDVLDYLRRIAGPASADGLSDRELLRRFAARRDEGAFAQLVWRHGALVWAVCLRVLRHRQDAEDAFQATFLVLARKAPSVRWRADIGNWLYAVAVRTALKVRAAAARQQRHERRLPEGAAEPPCPACRDELRPVLDEELGRLPDKYRAPVVLHYLEGKTYAEAARILGWPEGTVAARLARARRLLRGRLVRRGVALSAGSLAVVLAAESAAAPPALLLEQTARAGAASAGGGGLAGVVSPRVVLLTEEVLRAMLLTKRTIAVGVLLAIGILGLGAGVLSHQLRAAGQAGGAPGAEPAAQAAGAEPAKGKEDALRQEVERLNQDLAKMREKLAALEAKLGPAEPAAQGVLYQGKPADYWIKGLKDRDPAYRVTAVTALGAIAEEDPKLIPAIAGVLKNRYNDERAAAAKALSDLGPAAGPAVPQLVEALRTEDCGYVGDWVREALIQIGPAAVPALVKALQDSDKERRVLVVWALAGGGAAAAPPLTEALRDEASEVRARAAESLGSLGLKGKAAVPALVEALNDPDREVRYKVADALGSIGPDAKEALPALNRVWQRGKDDYVRSAVTRGLWKIDPVQAIQAGVRYKDIGPYAKYAVPALVEGLKDKDPHVRELIAATLGEIGPNAEPAVPALRQALQDEDADVRNAAAQALQQIRKDP